MNRDKIIVTGGAGLIGSHLCRRLLAEGNQVICIDNFATSRRDLILDLLGNPAFELISRDVTIPYFMRASQIYHLASAASPPTYQNFPAETIRTAVQGTINMLELARQSGATMLLASSGSVYGNAAVSTLSEEYWGNVNPVGVRSCNEEGKRAAEAACVAYRLQYHTDTRMARIFNTYGPGVDTRDGRAIPNFIYNALRGEDIVIYGNGMQTRCFCYVDDMVDGLIRLMNTRSRDRNEPVNLGSDREIAVRSLAEEVIRLTGSRSRIVNLAPDKPVRHRRTPDLRRAHAMLGWEATTPITEGLCQTIEYFTRAMQDDPRRVRQVSWVEMG